MFGLELNNIYDIIIICGMNDIYDNDDVNNTSKWNLLRDTLNLSKSVQINILVISPS